MKRPAPCHAQKPAKAQKCISISLQTLAGQHDAVVSVDAGATLGVLRALIATSINLEKDVELSLVHGELALTKAMDHKSLADLCIHADVALTLVKEPVLKVLTASSHGRAHI